MNSKDVDLFADFITNKYKIAQKKLDEQSKIYSLKGILKEYENGYEGNFSIKDTDMRFTYDKYSGTILVLTGENGKYPASISTKFLSAEFVKEKLLLDNVKAFELINNGTKVYFEAAITNIKYSGWIVLENEYPKYNLHNKVGNFSDEWLLLNALFHGKWNI